MFAYMLCYFLHVHCWFWNCIPFANNAKMNGRHLLALNVCHMNEKNFGPALMCLLYFHFDLNFIYFFIVSSFIIAVAISFIHLHSFFRWNRVWNVYLVVVGSSIAEADLVELHFRCQFIGKFKSMKNQIENFYAIDFLDRLLIESMPILKMNN